MKKTRSAVPGSHEMGPLPAEPLSASARRTEAQTLVLDALRRLDRPALLAELTTVTALHANTLRDHLAALEAEGQVAKATLAPQGRGRPAVTYTAVPSKVDPVTREYAGLAAAMATTLRRLSRHPASDAVQAGRDWGRELAASSGLSEVSRPLQRRRAVVTMLERLRFAPQANATVQVVRLTRCPLLEVAHEYPDIVCNIHRGVVEGMLQAWGDEHPQAELQPFIEAGACVLRFPSRKAPLDA